MSAAEEPVQAEVSGEVPGAKTPETPETAALRAELDQMRDRWQRAAADADNARKRCDRLIAERAAYERQQITAAWLPVLDHLDLALQHAEADPGAIVQGVAQVRQEARAVLARLGFAPLGKEGEAFDPARHEAAEAVEDVQAAPGEIVRVLRPGYGGEAGLLRPAVVAVAKPPSLPPDEGPDDGG